MSYFSRENEALWKEIASLRQKHHHQQQIVNKLIHFLVHLVNPSSLGLKRTRPLMIDSHSAAKFSNLGELKNRMEARHPIEKDQILQDDNESIEFPHDIDDDGSLKSKKSNLSSIDDEDDGDEYVISTVNKSKSGQIVEIDDFEEKSGLKNAEIETINRSKNGAAAHRKKQPEDYGIVEEAGEDESVPLAKRLKSDDSRPIESKVTYQFDVDRFLNRLVNMSGSIKGGKELVSVNPDSSFLNPNIFLNTPASALAPAQDLSNMNLQMPTTNSPIISSPSSPSTTLDLNRDSVVVNQISPNVTQPPR